MANLMKVLKEEIARIARSEINAALKPIKSVNSGQRKYIADLRRQVNQLEKENKQCVRQFEKLGVPQKKKKPEEPAFSGWITSQGICSMRKRFRLSQKAFAKLVGVSLPTISNWESPKNSGKLKIRKKVVFDRLMELKDMGLRDIQKEFEKMDSPQSDK